MPTGNWGARAAKVWWYSRVLALTSTAYAIGYQQAIIAYARDPERKDQEIITGLIQQGGASAILPSHSPEARLIEHVGRKVLEASRQHCKLKLAELKAITDQQLIPERLALPQNDSQGSLFSAVTKRSNHEAVTQQLAEETAFWEAAHQNMSKPWSFIVCQSSSANAFVSDMAPYRIFVFSGLLVGLKLTPDELALCLAHEVAHNVLGHSQAKSDVDYYLTHLHMLLLISLPELVFVQEIATFLLSSLVQSNFSRGYKYEADALGAQIAARACFDPVKGANLFNKLSKLENRAGASVTSRASRR